MIAKLSTAMILALLAFAALWDNSLNAGYLLGLLFLFLAVVTLSKWEIIRGAFCAAKDESELPIIRLAGKVISGMISRHASPTRRSPSLNR